MAAAVHYAKRVLRDTPIGEVPGPVEAFLRLVEEVVADGQTDQRPGDAPIGLRTVPPCPP